MKTLTSRLLLFFKINCFQNILQEHCQSVIQFGSSSGSTSGSKLFAKSISKRQKLPLNNKVYELSVKVTAVRSKEVIVLIQVMSFLCFLLMLYSRMNIVVQFSMCYGFSFS